MESNIAISNIMYDDFDVIKNEIDGCNKFQIHLWEDWENDLEEEEDYKHKLGFWIESVNKEINCTLLLSLDLDDAFLLAKNILAMIEYKSLKIQ